MGLTALSLSLLRGALDSRHIVIVSDPIDYPTLNGAMTTGEAGLSPTMCKTAYFHLIGSVLPCSLIEREMPPVEGN